jgi:hypothetical protein
MEAEKPIDFGTLHRNIQRGMAEAREMSRKNAEKYIELSGTINKEFLSKFDYAKEGSGITTDYTPVISLPLLVERFFPEGAYKEKSREHDSYSHSIPVEDKHSRIPMGWGHTRYKHVSGYNGLDLEIGLLSQDEKTVGDMAAHVRPSSTSVENCSAYINDLRIKREEPEIGFLFVHSPITPLANYALLSRFFNNDYSSGFFFVESGNEKNLFRVSTTYCERGKGIIEDRSSMEEIAKFNLEEGTKTPRTDIVTQFMEAVFQKPEIVQKS